MKSAKNRAEPVFFVRRQPRNFENVTLAVHRSHHFWGFWAIFVVAELPTTLGSHSDPPSYSVL